MSKLRELGGRQLSPETLMMGFGYEPVLSEGAIKPPIFQSSTFVFRSAEEGKRFFEVAYGMRDRKPGESIGLIYSRINNPNLEILEDRLAIWDGAERALVFASGMAAIATTVLALCEPGDALIYSAPGYGGAEYLFRRILPRLGILTFPVATATGGQAMRHDIMKIAEDARSRGQRLALMYVETPANPTNELTDLAEIVALARDCDAARPPRVVVDNTFLGPLWQRPLEHGVDVVLYSLTKYVGGHSDLIAGAALGGGEVMARIGEMRTICGTTCDAHTAWLLLRSLETLKIRMECATRNARQVVEFLERHPAIEQVLYPEAATVSSAQRAIYQRQCSGPGSTLSFRIHGGERDAFRLLNELELFKLAVSLGGTESLASHPASMTHCDYAPETKRKFGIGDNLIRLSIGLEDPRDLIVDLQAGLAAMYA